MNSKGFTLIELIMVVVIIGIISQMAIPRYEKRIELEELRAEKKVYICDLGRIGRLRKV